MGASRHASAPRYEARLPVEQHHWAQRPETNPWFWNPGRIGVETTPIWFKPQLHNMDPDLEVAWNRDLQRWAVWVRTPRLQTPMCQGWKLLFIVKHADGRYCPLDERTLAKIYSVSGDQWGDGRKYFDAVVREMEREREAAERWDQADTAGRAGEYFDFTQPKVGYGPISASKVVGQ